MNKKMRWFRSYEYNMVRVVEMMTGIIKSSGGEVKGHSDELEIHSAGYRDEINTLKSRIRETQLAISNCINPEENEKLQEVRQNAVDNMEQKLLRLERMEEDAPVVRTEYVSLISDIWFRFRLDGFEYYFQIDSNPFFPDQYQKIPVGEKGTFYLEDIECADKAWLFNGLFKPVATDDTIQHAAEVLLETLKGLNPSEKCSR